MTKLAGLIAGLAAALQVPPSRVRTAAAQLRKHKLLTSGPRGPGAPEMTPQDATNLLLAVMYDGELAEAHETVSQLRAARIRFIEGIRFTDGHREILKTPPKNGFMASEEGETFDLGTVIEILLDWFVRYGRADEGGDEDIDLDPVNIGLEITSPGYRARLNFNTPYGLFWRVDYEWRSAEQLEYEAANKGNITIAAWASRKGPYMWSSRSIKENSLWRIADCLRGYEWDDRLDEIQPPYEVSEEREAIPA